MKIDKPDKDNKFIKYEVLERSYSVLVMLDALLHEHEGLKNGELQKKFDTAQEALGDLYQEAGKIALL